MEDIRIKMESNDNFVSHFDVPIVAQKIFIFVVKQKHGQNLGVANPICHQEK